MRLRYVLFIATVVLTACVAPTPEPAAGDRQWLAGDHHVHSRFSVGWDETQEPPEPIVGGDAIYPIPMNVLMARHNGLSWMVSTDHGGPNHSKVQLELAYPETLLSRQAVPEVIQFYGMEFDPPAGDHASLILPHTHDESDVLYELESRFDRYDAWPADPARDTEEHMLEALRAMDALDHKPVLIANHPSRSAPGPGEYGLYHPGELRGWNDTAPEIAVGMAGAPGHQAASLDEAGDAARTNPRGAYGGHPTMGGFDQMTARLGGFWDTMLGEGRRWWITANSDSHVHFSEGGWDFWPGEYSKTYVYADHSYDDILGALRSGRIFVTTGDLISKLFVTVEGNEDRRASIGGTLEVPTGTDVTVTIRFLDPAGENHGGRSPRVRRVDLIMGEVTGPVADSATDINPTTRVLRRFTAPDWLRDGPYLVMNHTLRGIDRPIYIRVRGTNGTEPEPQPDPLGEDPWEDLWFYSNPVFIEVGG